MLNDTKSLFRHTHTSNESSPSLGDSQYPQPLEESSSRAENVIAFEGPQIMERRVPLGRGYQGLLQAEWRHASELKSLPNALEIKT